MLYIIKDELLSLKRLSGKMSRDVRKFWLKINKVITFKQKSESDEIRQKVTIICIYVYYLYDNNIIN